MRTPLSAPDIYDKQLNAGKAASAALDASDPLDINAQMGAIAGKYYLPVLAPAGDYRPWQPKYDISIKDAFVRAKGLPIGGAESVEIIKLAADGITETLLGTITVAASTCSVNRITQWTQSDLNILGLTVGESILIRSTTGVTGGCELCIEFVNK